MRIGFIARVVAEPGVGVRFKRRMRTIAWFGVGLLLVTAVPQLRQMAEVYAPQRTRVDLVLGRYPEAIRRARDLDGEWVELRSLAELASELIQQGGVDDGRLERAFRGDLGRGEWARARGWAALLALRGSAPAADFLRLMELVDGGAGEGPEAQSLRAQLPPSWRVLR